MIKRKNCPSTNDTNAEGKVRAKNFSEDDDVILAKAYVAATLNPLIGTDQKLEAFWASVSDRFHEMYKLEIQDQDYLLSLQQTWRSLEQRYKKFIQPDVTKWVSVTRNNPIPSGCDESTWVTQLREEFRLKFGRPFRFYKVYLRNEKVTQV